MVKKIIMFIFSIITPSLSGDLVQLASKEVLAARLENVGLPRFCRTTGLLDIVADTQIEPNYLLLLIEHSVNYYVNSTLKSIISPLSILIIKIGVLEALLKEHPTALQEVVTKLQFPKN